MKSDKTTIGLSPDPFAGNVIGAFARALSDKIERAVRKSTGLSGSACSAIVTVGSEPGSSIETLRRMLSLEHSSLVRLLNGLEKRGLLERHRGVSRDQRAVKVYLTERGEESFTSILDARRAVLDEALSTLETNEREDFVRMLAKMMPGVVDAGDDQHYVCRLCELEACPQDICPVNLAHPEFFELPESPFRRKHASNRRV